MKKELRFRNAMRFLLFLVALCVLSFATANASVTQQGKTVTGTVIDNLKEAVIGANVVIKGTTTGTVTDIDGKYTLENVPANAILQFSYIGFSTREIAVGNQTVIDVTLSEDAQKLEEVVVVGYGTMRKTDVTGSISTTKGDDMKKAQTFNALDALRGKAAGVNIYSNSGQPGAYKSRVVIRGNSTILASNDPLYIVDGVAMSDFYTVNPNDIESIEVLKDASSAAIYGARGANGVILVTTKRGNKEQGVKVSYEGSVSMNTMARYMDLLNAKEWTDAFMQGIANENKWLGKDLSTDRAYWFNDPDYFDASGNPLYDTDWQKESTRTSISHNHQLNIQQRGEMSSMGAFLNYTDQQGIMNNTYSKRLSAKIAYDADPFPWLTTSVNLMVNHTWSRYTKEDTAGQDARRTMIEMIPWYPLRDKNGNYTMSSSSSMNERYGFEGMANAPSALDLQNLMQYNTKIFGNVALTFHLLDGLDLKTQFGIDASHKPHKEYSSITLNNISMPNGWAERTHAENFYWQEETYLTYNKAFGDHRVNAMAGLSWMENTYNWDKSHTEGFDDDFFQFYNMSAGTIPSAPESDWSRWRMNSYFLRLGYTYNDRYSATVTGRVDGSSKFGENNKYAFFPSGGLAWNVSNEDFMKDIPLISNLKLHTNYGLTGNSEIGVYQSLSQITTTTTLLDGKRAPMSNVTSIANPDLKWEKTAQFDVGFDLGLFNQRLTLEASYYNKKTTDMLLQQPLPHSTGFTMVTKNVGSVRNQGVEFMLSGHPIQTNDFSWTSTLNMSYNKNEVLELGANNADILTCDWVGGPQGIVRVGEALNSFYGYRRLGIYTEEDYKNGVITDKSKIGRPHRSDEKEILGKGVPDWTGSFINNFAYKNFDLTVDFQFVLGVETMQQYFHSTYDRFGLTNGLKAILTDAYNGTNPGTMEQAIFLANPGFGGQDTTVDSQWVCDGSYLRLNMVQLGYTLTPAQAKALHLAGLRVYVSGNNLFQIVSDDYKGFDPESTSRISDDDHDTTAKFGQNMTFFAYPRARVFTLGVNLTF